MKNFDKKIYYPEDKISFWKLIPMGMQQVVAMFGATVLAPILMGFDPQLAIFFSGIGTLTFIIVTGFKVPGYLGSSFAFIGPVLAVTGSHHENIPFALCGIMASALIYALIAMYTMKFSSSWIDKLMPPLVTGSVVALIGLNLASTSLASILNQDLSVKTQEDFVNLSIASLTFFTAAFVSIYTRGIFKLLPILIGVLVGYSASFFTGLISEKSLAQMSEASWFGLPTFITPEWSLSSIFIIIPVVVVLIAENKGLIAAISTYMGRDLNPLLGRAYLGNAIATFVASLGGGTPQTTYAENIGVMAITRVFAISNFIAASFVAIILGLCPKFGALIQSIPNPVLGGITLVLYSLITMMGIKIWLDAKVDFSKNKNLFVAGVSLIVATGIASKGVTLGDINLAGIALGTLLAIFLNFLFSFKEET